MFVDTIKQYFEEAEDSFQINYLEDDEQETEDIDCFAQCNGRYLTAPNYAGQLCTKCGTVFKEFKVNDSNRNNSK